MGELCRCLATGLTTGMVLALACQPAGSDRLHVAMTAAADELRTAFNADSGKVRVVMLVAPT